MVVFAVQAPQHSNVEYRLEYVRGKNWRTYFCVRSARCLRGVCAVSARCLRGVCAVCVRCVCAVCVHMCGMLFAGCAVLRCCILIQM